MSVTDILKARLDVYRVLTLKRKVAVYVRVSSAGQKENLERNKNHLVVFAGSQGYEDIIPKNIVSDLNEKRRDLKKIFDSVLVEK